MGSPTEIDGLGETVPAGKIVIYLPQFDDCPLSGELPVRDGQETNLQGWCYWASYNQRNALPARVLFEALQAVLTKPPQRSPHWKEW